MIRFIGNIYPYHQKKLPLEDSDILVANMATYFGRDIKRLEKGLDGYQNCAKNFYLRLSYDQVGAYQTEDLMRLQSALKEWQINYWMIGEHISFVEDRGMKVAFLHYCLDDHILDKQKDLAYQMRCYEPDPAKIEIEKLRQRGIDRIIIMMNFKNTQFPTSQQKQRKIAHWCIDHGADLFLGLSTGSIREYEIYRNKGIFYGVGQFLMQDMIFNPSENLINCYQSPWQRQGLVIDYDPYHNSVVRIDQILWDHHKIERKRNWSLTRYFGGEIIGWGRRLWSKVYCLMMEKSPKTYTWIQQRKDKLKNFLKK